MSITFQVCTDEPVTESYRCQCLEPDYSGEILADPCCSECKGTGEITFTTGKHELNLANGNAIYLLQMLGIDNDESYVGTIPHHHLRMLEISIASALEHNAEALAPTANNYWRHKLLGLQALVTYARGTDQDLHWG